MQSADQLTPWPDPTLLSKPSPSPPAWETNPPATLINFSISFPLCDQEVLEAVVRISGLVKPIHTGPSAPPAPRVGVHITRGSLQDTLISLPKRPFRALQKASASRRRTTLAYIQYLYTLASELGLKVRTNSHEGYALIWAVQSLDRPIIELLLQNGADPGRKKALAVQVAILNREVEIVKLLVEAMEIFGKRPVTTTTAKASTSAAAGTPPEKLKMGDLLLARALRCDATDIVDWLVSEKGCVPSTQVLEMTAGS